MLVVIDFNFKLPCLFQILMYGIYIYIYIYIYNRFLMNGKETGRALEIEQTI